MMKTDGTRLKRILRACFRVVGGLIMGGLIGFSLVFIVYPWCGYRVEFWLRDFDSSVWKSETMTVRIQHTERRKMIRDLTRNHLRPGTTVSEVRGLLSEPYRQDADTMRYWLGYPRWGSGFCLDHDALEISLDENGRVISCRVIST